MKNAKIVSAFPLCVLIAMGASSSSVRADDSYHPYYYASSQSASAQQEVVYIPAEKTVSETVPVTAPAPVVNPVTSVHAIYGNDNSNDSVASAPTSYAYTPTYDTAKPAYVTPKAEDARRPLTASSKKMDVGTLTGWQVGAQASLYRYQEHVVANHEFMHLIGPKIGITVEGMKSYASGYFWGADLRFAYGISHYRGGDVDINTGLVTPSTRKNDSDITVEGRFLGGYDFIFRDAVFGRDYSFSPYIGLGYRYLFNKPTETDSLGVSGYSRTSNYVYFPVGLTQRILVNDTQRISVNLEYDQLILGKQKSALSQVGLTDISNDQNSGYGARFNFMYEWPTWSVGPFFMYWNIDQSNTVCAGGFCGNEPHNQTIEYGLQGKYRF